MYLYLDTTHQITIGLLDKDFKWVDYQYLLSKKSSAVIHSLIYEMLEKFDLKVGGLTGVFYAAGPGSYTGMRVSEGIKDILQWQNISVNSFYHFQIPEIVGRSNGTWISRAFKGELFVYRWDGEESGHNLIRENEFKLSQEACEVFSGHEQFDDASIVLTKDLIHDNSEKIFHELKSRDQREELFYYRPLDEEFTRKQ